MKTRSWYNGSIRHTKCLKAWTCEWVLCGKKNFYSIIEKLHNHTLKVKWHWVWLKVTYESWSQIIKQEPTPLITIAHYHDSPLYWQVTYAISEKVFLEEEEKCLLIAQWTKSRKIRIMATSFLVQNEEFRAQHFDLKEFPICKNTWNCCDCAKETTQNVEPNGQQSFLEESHRLRIAKFCCIVIWLSHHHKSSDYWRRAKNFKGCPQPKKPNPNLMFKRLNHK
jgi:hypothetical protein